MILNRRRFLGVFGLGSAGLIITPGGAVPHAHSGPLRPAEPALPFVGPLDQGRHEPPLLARAKAALAQHGRSIAHHDTVGIVDFAAPSRQPRFHLLDMATGKVSTHLVAHGRGSDPANSGWVEQLSNRPGSNASCGGSFVTGEIYHGKHGRSRRLIGLERENDMAGPRGIVIHAASYVDDGMAQSHGRIGRSQGCFAVSQGDIDMVLARLGPGRLLLATRLSS